MTSHLEPTAKRKILIVDDERTLTGLLKKLLERKCAYEVRVQNDPRSALPAAVAFKPHVILLDIIMPEMTGGDVAALMRRQDATKHIPIVFISAISEPIAGFPFLRKPARLEDVIACIEQHALRAGESGG